MLSIDAITPELILCKQSQLQLNTVGSNLGEGSTSVECSWTYVTATGEGSHGSSTINFTFLYDYGRLGSFFWHIRAATGNGR